MPGQLAAGGANPVVAAGAVSGANEERRPAGRPRRAGRNPAGPDGRPGSGRGGRSGLKV